MAKVGQRRVKEIKFCATSSSKTGREQNKNNTYRYVEVLNDGVEIPYSKTCLCCGQVFTDGMEDKKSSEVIGKNFYRDVDSINNFDCLLPMCKNCIYANSDNSATGVVDKDKLIKTLLKIGRPFDDKLFNTCFENGRSSKQYFRVLSSLPQYRDKSFLDLCVDTEGEDFCNRSNADKKKLLANSNNTKKSIFDYFNNNFNFSTISNDLGFDIAVAEEDEEDEDDEEDEESLLPQRTRKRYIRKWGERSDADLIYLEKEFEDYCKRQDFTELSVKKYEKSIMELCTWFLAARDTVGIGEKKIISDSIDRITKSLGVQRKDDKEADEGLSIGEVFAVSELHEGFVNFGKYKTRYKANQDLVSKTLVLIINSIRRSIGGKAQMLDSIYDLLDDKDSYFNSENINVNNHLDEIDDDVSSFDFNYKETMAKKEEVYLGNFSNFGGDEYETDK